LTAVNRQEHARGSEVNESEARIRVHSRQAAGQVYNSKVTQSVHTGLVQEDAWSERR